MQELIGTRLLKPQPALVTQTRHWLAMTREADHMVAH